jgi:hypothetical protein
MGNDDAERQRASFPAREARSLKGVCPVSDNLGFRIEFTQLDHFMKGWTFDVLVYCGDDPTPVAQDAGRFISRKVRDESIRRIIADVNRQMAAQAKDSGQEQVEGQEQEQAEDQGQKAENTTMTPKQIENFTLEFESAWLEYHERVMAEIGAGPAQAKAASELKDTEEAAAEADVMLRSSDLVQRIRADFEAIGIAGESDLALTLYLVTVSRLLPTALSARVHGFTTSGKSFVIDQVALLLPPKACHQVTRLTPQCLYHVPRGYLKHACVIGGERSRRTDLGAAEDTRALRELQSGRGLRKWFVHNGITQEIDQEGPTVFIESTTLAISEIFREDLNRCLDLQTDESAAQTRRILWQMADKFSGQPRAASLADVIAKHVAAQRMLNPYEVVIPFAHALAAAMDDTKIESRRVLEHIYTLIQAVTILHQYQRPEASEGVLLATPDDYGLARRLLVPSVKRLLGGGLSAEALEFYAQWKVLGQKPFTTSQVCKHPKDRPAVHRWLGELRTARAVEIVKEGSGNRPTTWEFTGRDPRDADLLPSVEEIAQSVETQECNAQGSDTLRLA